MKAYKLLKVRKDGTIGPLFIGRKKRMPLGEWMEAEDIPTKGYARRPGWHVTKDAEAPHLSMKGRRWYEVEVKDYYEFPRPKNQGGVWLIANWMRIIKEL